eukprot:1686128-Rhodomonas_salina.1
MNQRVGSAGISRCRCESVNLVAPQLEKKQGCPPRFPVSISSTRVPRAGPAGFLSRVAYPGHPRTSSSTRVLAYPSIIVGAATHQAARQLREIPTRITVFGVCPQKSNDTAKTSKMREIARD